MRQINSETNNMLSHAIHCNEINRMGFVESIDSN